MADGSAATGDGGQQPGRIQAIDAASVHRICSGQVITQLATAVKELVENALDAGATTVEVKLREYGAEAIEVVDNGRGIPPEDYEGVATKYATSKIRGFADIFSVTSFGFRGEALSSLCEVADGLVVITRTASDGVGTKLEYNRVGTLVKRSPIARTVGTTVIVNHLFKPLPVRYREFLKGLRKQYARALLGLQAYALIATGARILVSNTITGSSADAAASFNVLSKSSGVQASWSRKQGGGGSGATQDDGEDEEEAGPKTTLSKGRHVVISTSAGTASAAATAASSADGASVAFMSGLQNNVADVFGVKFLSGLQPLSLSVPLSRPPAAARNDDAGADDMTADADAEAGVDAAAESVATIQGLVSKAGTGVGRSNTERQFVYINQRPVDIPKLQKVLNDVWRQYEMGHKPAAVLNLRLPAGTFDVNVTPDKREVLLSQEAELCDALRAALERLWESSRYTFQVSPLVSAQMDLPSMMPRSAASSASSTAVSPSGASGVVSANSSFASDYASQQGRVSLSNTAAQRGTAAETPRSVRGRPVIVEESDEEEEATAAAPTAAPAAAPMDDSGEDEGDGGLVEETPMPDDGQVDDSGGAQAVQDDTVLDASYAAAAAAAADEEEAAAERAAKRARMMAMLDKGKGSGAGSSGGVRSPGRGASIADVMMRRKQQRQARQEPEGEDFGAVAASPAAEQPQAAAQALEQQPLTGRKRRRETVTAPQPVELDDSTVEESVAVARQQEADTHRQQSESVDMAAIRALYTTRATQRQAWLQISSHVYADAEQELPRRRLSLLNNPLDLDVMPLQVEVGEGQETAASSSGGGGGALPEAVLRKLLGMRAGLFNALPSSGAGSGSSCGGGTGSATATGAGSTSSADGMTDAASAAASAASVAASASAAASATATAPGSDGEAEAALSRVLRKHHFVSMSQRVFGQFNLGFIVAGIGSDLFILDQHACDEKYQYERLQATTVIHEQRLLIPRPLELTATEELLVQEHLPVFNRNGFHFELQPDAAAGQRVKLTAVPFSKNIQFGDEDVRELASLLREMGSSGCCGGHGGDRAATVRLPKALSMFASRACRTAIMIGTALKRDVMRRVVYHLSALEQPWNCPHGRPTLRHLVDLAQLLQQGTRRLLAPGPELQPPGLLQGTDTRGDDADAV